MRVFTSDIAVAAIHSAKQQAVAAAAVAADGGGLLWRGAVGLGRLMLFFLLYRVLSGNRAGGYYGNSPELWPGCVTPLIFL
eukprot:SAG11_NODE_5154_length_1645_cov_3.294955_1_plen_81_part_00